MSEKLRSWSYCADAQAGLHLCCTQTPEDRVSHVEAQLKDYPLNMLKGVFNYSQYDRSLLSVKEQTDNQTA